MKPRERRRSRPPTDDAVVHRFVHGVAETIERRRILNGGERCVLGVSGGADSLALLHAMALLAERFRLDLVVGHFDHGTRADSADDAEFVAGQAAELGIEAVVGRLSAERPKDRSPEDFWRIERERFLAGVARERQAARILTGHTQDDQAETVLANLLTGAGKRGLGGMLPARWRIGRPLFDRTRAETEAFCAAVGVEPRNDPTNLDPAYTRNRIRHEILPRLREESPQIAEHLATLADVVREEDFLLDRLAADAVRAEETETGTAMRAERLRDLPLALQRRGVRLLARNENSGLTFAQCESLIRLALEGREGARIDLGGALSARLEDGLLVVGRAPDPAPTQGDAR